MTPEISLRKVGIIGTGWIFQNEHILGYLSTNSGYIVGFFDISEEIAKPAIIKYKEGIKKRLLKAKNPEEKKLCEKALNAKYYSNVKDLIREVDALDICTPPQYHIYYAQMAAKEGKAVLCEKPLARSYIDAAPALPDLSKIPFYLFTQVIYNPIFKMGKKIIEKGVIGDVISMRCCHATLDLNHTVEKAAFWNPQISGGGALKDIGPHAYSVLRYWLGKDVKLKAVKAIDISTEIKIRTIAREENTQIHVEDKAIVQIKWEKDGKEIPTKLEAYWIDKKNLPPELKFGLYHEVIGTKGKMIFPNGTLGFLLGKKPYFGIHVFFKIIRNDGTIEKISMPQPKPHAETLVAIDEFLQQKESRSPAWYGEDMMKIFDAAYLSKKENGKEISMEEFDEFCKDFLDLAKNDREKAGSEFIKQFFPKIT